MLFLSSADFFKSTFSKNSFRNTIRVSNSLDPDQARQNVGPDLGPNCMQRLSADDTGRQKAMRNISEPLTFIRNYFNNIRRNISISSYYYIIYRNIIPYI